MNYLVGDVIRIRTWESMKKEYGLNENSNIIYSHSYHGFPLDKENFINKDYPDRIFTIDAINNHYNFYSVKETWFWHFEDWMIEPEPIVSRWEILDL